MRKSEQQKKKKTTHTKPHTSKHRATPSNPKREAKVAKQILNKSLHFFTIKLTHRSGFARAVGGPARALGLALAGRCCPGEQWRQLWLMWKHLCCRGAAINVHWLSASCWAVWGNECCCCRSGRNGQTEEHAFNVLHTHIMVVVLRPLCSYPVAIMATKKTWTTRHQKSRFRALHTIDSVYDRSTIDIVVAGCAGFSGIDLCFFYVLPLLL